MSIPVITESAEGSALRNSVHIPAAVTLFEEFFDRRTKVGIDPRFLDYIAIKVKSLPENRILANHRVAFLRVGDFRFV